MIRTFESVVKLQNALLAQDDPPDRWHQTASCDHFARWNYKNTPYRVIAHLGDRGHHEALFTTTYPHAETALIQGNCGGGWSGMRKATRAAESFIEEHKHGCPPPSEISL